VFLNNLTANSRGLPPLLVHVNRFLKRNPPAHTIQGHVLCVNSKEVDYTWKALCVNSKEVGYTKMST